MGKVLTFYDKFKFLVESEALGGQMGFMTCSGPEVELETIEHNQGGITHPHKSPGRATFPPMTFTRGGSEDNILYDWFLSSYNASAGTGGVAPGMYATLDVIQQDYAGNTVKRWTLYNAWCKSFKTGDFDNSASEKRVEEITVEYEYFELGT